MTFITRWTTGGRSPSVSRSAPHAAMSLRTPPGAPAGTGKAPGQTGAEDACRSETGR
ncbi:hypothetical protein AAK943_05900 [Emergencia timonensis]|uniref:hypothetical protein n=1 Tax=Emergencia timonensis TaxID=1776384 RepID=UPI0012E83FCE|nr:hypothetical protein [Emergencia timonensis]WNX89898.1 hypothetical protein RVY71_06390 [Emergencia timonensis]